MELEEKAKKLLSEGIVYLATSSEDIPNITITQSGVVLPDNRVLICDCEMSRAKSNILKNPSCCLVVYDEKKEQGYKIFGSAEYFDSGQYLEQAKKRLEGEPYKPKGAVVIKVEELIEIK